MAVTLAQVRLASTDDLQQMIIDEFRKSSFLLDNLTFDDVVNPAGGGASWAYTYLRVKTQATAAFRAVNNEFQAQEAEKEPFTATLAIFGGSFQIDRVLTGIGFVNELQWQLQQKIKAASALFGDTVINGDTGPGGDANSFDGLDKAVTGSSTEYNADGAPINLSTAEAVQQNADAFVFALEDWLGLLDGKPSFIASNSKGIARIKAVARHLGYFSQSEDAFGRKVDTYDGIPLVDLGDKPGNTNPVVAIDAEAGTTSLYAARLGLDGFHAVSLAGRDLIKRYLPDLNAPGAVKTGEVELVSAVVLKATKAAGVFRNLQVSPAAG